MQTQDDGAVMLPARLDGRNTAEVREALTAAFDASDGDLVVDLSAVEVVDATGLGVLVGVRRRADAAGRTVVLRGTPARVRRLLNATHLTRLFVLEDAAATGHGEGPDVG
jgi:anti-anti-sigma factor